MEKKRIAVVTIGGTFFMYLKKDALAPGPVELPPLRKVEIPPRHANLNAQKLLTIYGDEKTRIDPEDIIIEHHALFNIDSSRLRRHHLNELGKKLAALSNDPEIDGVVVISGTDRMHRVVTRLAHHLHNLNKSIVVTGAQVPLIQRGSDARRNYESSVRAAVDLTGAINHVVLCFGQKKVEDIAEIQHPLNVLKADPTSLDAFNHPYKRIIGRVSWGGGTSTTKLGKQLLTSGKAKKLRRIIDLVKRTTRPGQSMIVRRVAQAQRGRQRPMLDTTFTTLQKDLIDIVEVSETRTISEIKLNPKAKVIILRASGRGNLHEKALRQVATLANGRPVIVTTEAGADVDLTSYAPGVEALKKGMLPSGGLITQSSEIRAEYLAHHMDEIKEFATRNHPPGISTNQFKNKLFAALYLSGAKLTGKNTKKKHEEALGIKVLPSDALIDHTIEESLQRVYRALTRLTKPKKPGRKKQRKYEMGPQNVYRIDRLTRQTDRPLP